MMKRKFTAFILFTTLVGLACGKKPAVIEVGSVVYLSGDKVRLRSAPSAESATITMFRLGEKFTVTEKSPQQDTIGGTTEYWFKIENEKKNSGWIFGKFLSLTPVDQLDDLKAKMKGVFYYCTTMDKSYCTHIFEVKQDAYEYNRFDPNYGIIDSFTGKLSYSSDHILVQPLSRISRFAYYQNSLPYERQYDYTPYYGYVEGKDRLIDLNLGLEAEYKLYIMRCEDKIILSEVAPSNDDACKLNHSAYYK